jgi:hypothetical protein
VRLSNSLFGVQLESKSGRRHTTAGTVSVRVLSQLF